MNKFITKYIKEFQNWFLKGRQMENLTRRVLNIIYNIENDKSKAGILSLDIFKAFSCVE